MVLERPSPCKDLWDFLEVCGGALVEDIAWFVVAKATAAVDISCRRVVFHHNIKLENLLINTETLKVKLIDFGCRDLLQESGYNRFCGTLGVLLLRLVCGRFPKPRDMQMINDDIWWEPGLSKRNQIDMKTEGKCK
ncbi:serine/threonine-protein kinase pim-3-like isoform X2 [Sinocyclocheilus grahami]|uniref:serine/threonine-protein kinase pim-3-like isoform X2 n=1 Tax=Sinocyclocheilus grahami TaxID=75366 RepID=UPI0007AC9F76|nr:PREDICTED: serine/threonine-protein kinase pim-3-like isoform X2 [Sinocyclocheilus grahami]